MNNETVRERFWLWGHMAGSHNDWLSHPSHMTPGEGRLIWAFRIL